MITTDLIVALITLVSLEIILGIDNVIFISIISEKLPKEQRDKLRKMGIGLAMIMRLILLTAISYIMKLEHPLFEINDVEISGKDLILIVGGAFLMYKSTKEIYEKTENDHAEADLKKMKKASFGDLLLQILVLDIVFSIDSIITAVGMVDNIYIMYAAVIISVGIMMWASGSISKFIHDHPSFKILALCFLIVIGISLIAEGFGHGIPKGYIYFSMAFAFLVDVIQMKTSKPASTSTKAPKK
jgi:predicted tellurium resistance membrane protein TerC